MNAQTEAAITAVCGADPTIAKADFAAALRLLRGEKSAAGDNDEIITREEAARRLRVTPATVTNWGKSGVLVRVAIVGRRKALGFSRRSVEALISGSGAGAAAGGVA